MELRADRRYLTETAYADAGLLSDRGSLYTHQRPRIDLAAELLAALGGSPLGLVVDIGCGPGTYFGPLAYEGAFVIGLDLSLGMLRAIASPLAPLVVSDAASLPIRDAMVDTALAMHMLYHLPRPEEAVAEAARVLNDSGRLVAAVGGDSHLKEMKELWLPLLEEAGLDQELADLGLVNSRLPTERLDDLLRAHFHEVDQRNLVSKVYLNDPAPLVRYAASTTAAKVAAEQGAQMAARLEAACREVLAAKNEITVTTEVVLFAASRPVRR
jgi:SAM-dependent methyltransferase